MADEMGQRSLTALYHHLKLAGSPPYIVYGAVLDRWLGTRDDGARYDLGQLYRVTLDGVEEFHEPQ